MAYLTTDERRVRMHVLVKRTRAEGFSATAAIGEAIREIDDGVFPWWEHFRPTARDLELLRQRLLNQVGGGGAGGMPENGRAVA